MAPPQVWDVTTMDIPDVGRVTMVLPVVPENASPALREGIARRRLAMLDGRCPCGAKRDLPNRATRRAMALATPRGSDTWSMEIFHAEDCPASDAQLLKNRGAQ